jgi:hypothetical protein
MDRALVVGEQCRARVTIEYDVPEEDRVALREREERRWITSETLLALPSAVVKVELLTIVRSPSPPLALSPADSAEKQLALASLYQGQC